VLAFADACERVEHDARCLICLDYKPPASEIYVQDPEYDRNLHAVDHNVTYLDVAGEGGVDPDNPTYLDLRNVGDQRVDPGDLRLTARADHEPLSLVEPGDADVAGSTLHVTGSSTERGDEDVLYEACDGLSLNTDGAAIGEDVLAVDADHVRLAPETPNRTAAAEDPKAETPTGAPDTTVVGLDVEPAPVEPANPVRLTLTVENRGQAAGPEMVTTNIAGQVVDTRLAPPIEPGNTTQLVVTLPAPAKPGTVNVTAGQAAALLKVEPVEDPPTEAEDASEDNGHESQASTQESPDDEPTREASRTVGVGGAWTLCLGLAGASVVYKGRG
jgi:hypothetical protein